MNAYLISYIIDSYYKRFHVNRVITYTKLVFFTALVKIKD